MNTQTQETPRFQDIDLRALAERNGPERAFLSLYLSSPEALRSLNHRIEKVRALLAGDAVEQEYFDENLKLVETFLDQYAFTSGSLCLFTCWATEYVEAYPLEHEVRDLLWVDSSPYIRPLAELQDEYENFVLVAADNDATRVYFVTSDQLDQEERVKGGVKNHVKVGGWSQKRYQRRRDKQLHQYAKEVVAVLEELNQRERFDRILLLGSNEALLEIEDVLPEAIKAKIAGKRSVDLHDEDQVWDEGYHLFFEEERAAEEALWEQIQNEYLRGGRAAAGPEDVLKAAAVGRVQRMIVTRDAKVAGMRCRDCDNLSAGTPEACPFCDSGDVFTVDLINELVELLVLSNADTEFSDPIDGLREVGHVAALLRY